MKNCVKYVVKMIALKSLLGFPIIYFLTILYIMLISDIVC